MLSQSAQRLAPRQREFVDLHVIEGLSVAEAYCLAFGYPVSHHRNAAGNKLLKNVCVAQYAAELKKELAERSKTEKFLSLDEKREFLAQVVRTPIGRLHANHPLAQEVKEGRDGVIIKGLSKLQAIELDAKLSGELRDKLNIEVSPRVLDIVESLE